MRLKRHSIFILLLLLVAVCVSWFLVSDVKTVGEINYAGASESISAESVKIEAKKTLPTTTTISTTTTSTLAPTTTTTTLKVYSKPNPVIRRSSVNWYAIYECENGGYGWYANTGNGYYGGLQFSHETWIANGGGRYSSNANLTTPANQIAIASTMSLNNWPYCGKFG